MVSTAAKPSEITKPAWKPEQLPAFPAIALKALRLMAGRDTSLLELCDLIRADTGFSTAILKIANSPLVGFSREVTSVVEAAMLLGFKRLKSVVMTVGLKDYLKGPATAAVRACWQHSVACAMIAERSAQATGLDKDFAYTAGIMHDLGRAAMIASMPGYGQLIENEAEGPLELLQRERELAGLDHQEAGAKLVRLWSLPEAFLEITSCHHEIRGVADSVASVTALSCRMADSLGFGFGRYRKPGSYVEAVRTLPASAWDSFPQDADEIASEIAVEIAAIETV